MFVKFLRTIFSPKIIFFVQTLIISEILKLRENVFNILRTTYSLTLMIHIFNFICFFLNSTPIPDNSETATVSLHRAKNRRTEQRTDMHLKAYMESKIILYTFLNSFFVFQILLNIRKISKCISKLLQNKLFQSVVLLFKNRMSDKRIKADGWGIFV